MILYFSENVDLKTSPLIIGGHDHAVLPVFDEHWTVPPVDIILVSYSCVSCLFFLLPDVRFQC